MKIIPLIFIHLLPMVSHQFSNTNIFEGYNRIVFAPLKLRTCVGAKDVCVPILKCISFAMELFRSNPGYALILMERNACGVQQNVLQVCCSHDEVTGVGREDSLLGHRNMKLLNLPGCGKHPLVEHMNHTRNALPGEFPWMAILMYRDSDVPTIGYRMMCAGSLISNSWVLTAAHCLKNEETLFPLKKVRLGEHNLLKAKDCFPVNGGKELCTSYSIEIDVSKIIPHPDFNSYDKNTYENDIGLVRLSFPVRHTSSIVSVCLPIPEQYKKATDWKMNNDLVVTGWGFTKERAVSLKKVRMTFVPPDDCKTQLKPWSATITPMQFCAKTFESVHVCPGDSGGPLVTKLKTAEGINAYHQTGIVSYTYGKCNISSISVYITVAAHLKWILENIS